MIVRRNEIIEFRYLVNNNSSSGYHKRLKRFTVQIHPDHKLHEARSKVVSEGLVIHDLEDSVKRIGVDKLIESTLVPACVQIRSQVDQRLEIFEYAPSITPDREVLQTRERNKLISLAH